MYVEEENITPQKKLNSKKSSKKKVNFDEQNMDASYMIYKNGKTPVKIIEYKSVRKEDRFGRDRYKIDRTIDLPVINRSKSNPK